MLRDDDNAAIISDYTIRCAIDRAMGKNKVDHETRYRAIRYLSDAIVELARENLDTLAERCLNDAKSND